ncbi:MAG: phosphomannomutase [Paracoccaceae bacterium]|jgi:phosphomannomutase
MDDKVSEMKKLTCFKAYDVRGELGVNFDISIAYRIGRAVARHFKAQKIVVGRDARETSPELADAIMCGIMDEGSNVLDLGLAGTEEMYWSVTHFGACAGVEVTASHNPINYNGVKIVKSGSRPLDDFEDFQVIKLLAEENVWYTALEIGSSEDISFQAREAYVERVLSFVDVSRLKPLKIVVNSGNGAAGPTFDAIADKLKGIGGRMEFIRVHHNPNHSFPNGIPNPLLPENHKKTASTVRSEGADFGVAFDGDFDRCFFFDEEGGFVPGEYVIGLIATIFLEKEPCAKIVHDPRVIWNTQDIVSRKGGVAIQSKTGHAFIKQTMRASSAVYGGEMSAHHYFRDFAYCDSGMIPWLLVAELVSTSGKSLGSWVESSFQNFPSSGEINFNVRDAEISIQNVLDKYTDKALQIDWTDGVSLSFENWRFNLRKSNTEPLVRLNIETFGLNVNLGDLLSDLSSLIKN